MTLTVKFIKENVIGADSVSQKNGIFTVRHSFFYMKGHTASEFANRVKGCLETPKLAIKIIDWGTEYKPFRGGASVSANSHWWVKFTMYDPTTLVSTQPKQGEDHERTND